MPFTATHVAAVLPFAWLCRWRLPLSALALGSMVPDIAGFYPGVFDHSATHSFSGVITHSVPLGLIGFYLFHLLLKQPLVDLLPDPLARRLADWSRGEIDLRPGRLLVVAGCIALGALTHIVWDSFTHGGEWGVAMFPFLQRDVIQYAGRPIAAYALFQHGSSLILLPPMTLGFVWWVMRQPIEFESMRRRVAMPRSISWTILAMMVVGAWIYFQSLLTNQVAATWVAALRSTVKHGGAVAIVMVLLYCVGMHLAWWIQSREVDSETVSLQRDRGEDRRLCAAEPAHDVLVSRRPRGASPEVMMVDAGQRPHDSAPHERSDAWS